MFLDNIYRHLTELKKKKDRMLARLCPWLCTFTWKLGRFSERVFCGLALEGKRRWTSREVVFLVGKAMRCQGRNNQPGVRETRDASKSSWGGYLGGELAQGPQSHFPMLIIYDPSMILWCQEYRDARLLLLACVTSICSSMELCPSHDLCTWLSLCLELLWTISGQ